MSILDGKFFELTIHKLLWNYIIDNPFAEKEDWPGWERYTHLDQDILNEADYCMCCYYNLSIENSVKEVSPTFPTCIFCPMEWPDSKCVIGYKGGLFGKFKHCQDPVLRVEYAKIIRELPVKSSVVYR